MFSNKSRHFGIKSRKQIKMIGKHFWNFMLHSIIYCVLTPDIKRFPKAGNCICLKTSGNGPHIKLPIWSIATTQDGSYSNTAKTVQETRNFLSLVNFRHIDIVIPISNKLTKIFRAVPTMIIAHYKRWIVWKFSQSYHVITQFLIGYQSSKLVSIFV